eukprot:520991-Rhodomonas_salina.1
MTYCCCCCGHLRHSEPPVGADAGELLKGLLFQFTAQPAQARTLQLRRPTSTNPGGSATVSHGHASSSSWYKKIWGIMMLLGQNSYPVSQSGYVARFYKSRSHRVIKFIMPGIG